jgi:hypothetical protein
MARLILLAFLVTPQLLGLQLRVEQEPQAKEAEAAADQQGLVCPEMPKSKKEWKESAFWAVLIDGKDAKEGPHVYDWDHQFFSKMTSSLSAMYKKEGTSQGKKKLSQKLVETMHRTVFVNEAGDKPGKYDSNVGGGGIMPQCTNHMSCDDVKSLLQYTPKELFIVKPKNEEQVQYNKHKSNKGCPRGLKPAILGAEKKEVMLGQMISQYNHGVEKAGENKTAALHELVKFVRIFAMMHPFPNGNGRVKNLILQREIRRLGIACGTMMYNYNKDVLVDGFPRHVRKVEEGIRVFDETVAAKGTENPWLDEKTVDRHKQDFDVIPGLDKCFAKKSFGSGGAVTLVYPDRTSVTPEDVA